jgi:hypothetical protein
MNFNFGNVNFAWIRFDLRNNDHEFKPLLKFSALRMIMQDSFVGIIERNAPNPELKFGIRFLSDVMNILKEHK